MTNLFVRLLLAYYSAATVQHRAETLHVWRINARSRDRAARWYQAAVREIQGGA